MCHFGCKKRFYPKCLAPLVLTLWYKKCYLTISAGLWGWSFLYELKESNKSLPFSIVLSFKLFSTKMSTLIFVASGSFCFFFFPFSSSNWNYKQCWAFFCYKGFKNFREGTFSGTAALFESVSRQRITEPKRAHHSESISQNRTMPEFTQNQSFIVLWTARPWMLGNHVESTAILTVLCYCDLVQLELTFLIDFLERTITSGHKHKMRTEQYLSNTKL